MDIDNPDVKCIEINPDDYKIRIKISPERTELRKQIYAFVLQVAITLYHFDNMTPHNISSLGEYMVESLEKIYKQIEKMDEAEGRAT